MAEVENLAVEILKEIRDEVRATRQDLSARIDQTNQRLDQTNQRLDQTNEGLGAVEGAVHDMAGQLVFLVRHAKNTTRRNQREFDDLKERVDRLETHTGLKQG